MVEPAIILNDELVTLKIVAIIKSDDSVILRMPFSIKIPERFPATGARVQLNFVVVNIYNMIRSPSTTSSKRI